MNIQKNRTGSIFYLHQSSIKMFFLPVFILFNHRQIVLKWSKLQLDEDLSHGEMKQRRAAASIFVWYKTVICYRIIIKVLKWHICTHKSLSALHLHVLWEGEEFLKWHPRGPCIIRVSVPLFVLRNTCFSRKSQHQDQHTLRSAFWPDLQPQWRLVCR